MTLNEAIFWLQHDWDCSYDITNDDELTVDLPSIPDEVINAFASYSNVSIDFQWAVYVTGNRGSWIDLSFYGGVNAGFGCIRANSNNATLTNYIGVGSGGESISGNPFGYSQDENSSSTDRKQMTDGSNGWFLLGTAWIQNPSNADHPQEYNHIGGSTRHIESVDMAFISDYNIYDISKWDASTDFVLKQDYVHGSIEDAPIDDDGQMQMKNLKNPNYPSNATEIHLVPVLYLNYYNGTRTNTNSSSIFIYPKATNKVSISF